MRALVLEEVDVAPSAKDVEIPTPADGEALVRISGAALNHRDVYISHGQYPGIVTPIVLGSDGCGVVEAVSGEQ